GGRGGPTRRPTRYRVNFVTTPSSSARSACRRARSTRICASNPAPGPEPGPQLPPSHDGPLQSTETPPQSVLPPQSSAAPAGNGPPMLTDSLTASKRSRFMLSSTRPPPDAGAPGRAARDAARSSRREPLHQPGELFPERVQPLPLDEDVRVEV